MKVRAMAAMLAACLVTLGLPAAPEARAIAVTFDDLPLAQTGATPCDPDRLRSFTRDFVAMLRRERMPAVAFANPGGTCEAIRPVVPELLDAWAAAGFELGSHTFSHPNINRVGLQAYQADVIAAEPVLKAAAARRGLPFRYFRHPFLFRGDTAETKAALDVFLAGRSYTVAPVTIDNSEWVYGFLYGQAKARGDSSLMARLGEAYLAHMTEVTAFFETYAVTVLGREPAQVLLLHANELNLAHFPKLKAMLTGRGYRFVSLAEALADPAYARADSYVARNGVSWLHRWMTTSGGELEREPEPPPWVMDLYAARPR